MFWPTCNFPLYIYINIINNNHTPDSTLCRLKISATEDISLLVYNFTQASSQEKGRRYPNSWLKISQEWPLVLLLALLPSENYCVEPPKYTLFSVLLLSMLLLEQRLEFCIQYSPIFLVQSSKDAQISQKNDIVSFFTARAHFLLLTFASVFVFVFFYSHDKTL